MSQKPKRIRVLRYFRGSETQEQVIAPGEYDVSDKELFGAAQALIDSEQAVVTEYETPKRTTSRKRASKSDE